MTPVVNREMKRRSAIEPVIDRNKNDRERPVCPT